jgi:transcriptional regulator with XRE-family HTH domain
MTTTHPIRAARQRLGMTQKDVADAIGGHVTTISGLEAGRYMPSLPTLYRLAEVLQMRDLIDALAPFLPDDPATRLGKNRKEEILV